jgi:hypothetical protein
MKGRSAGTLSNSSRSGSTRRRAHLNLDLIEHHGGGTVVDSHELPRLATTVEDEFALLPTEVAPPVPVGPALRCVPLAHLADVVDRG